MNTALNVEACSNISRVTHVESVAQIMRVSFCYLIVRRWRLFCCDFVIFGVAIDLCRLFSGVVCPKWLIFALSVMWQHCDQ
jgi:hypothetical protein